MNVCRIGRLVQISAPKLSARFSTGNPRFSIFSGGADEESLAYRHARIFSKPVSIKFEPNLRNSVSLVGLLDRPVRVLDTESDRFGVFTLLRVKDPRDVNRSFRMFLHMWDGMARKCIAHLKQNDLVYVSGSLVSHVKNINNTNDIYYQVKVTELNYVIPTAHSLDLQTSSESKSETVEREEAMDRAEEKLYLWHVFFANPYEWWDNRRSKKNPRQPDFKHKDTGEALWLNPKDPPWIRKQLELNDRRMAGHSHRSKHHSHLSEWIYDE